MSPSIATIERSQFHLFGSPISHSASPAQHNSIFASLDLPRHHYHLQDTKGVEGEEGERMLQLIRAPDFGGAGVTMPLKVSMMPHVDVLSPEVNEIGSLNTIIVDSVDPFTGRPVLLGRNTDWEGIHNAQLREAGESGMELFNGRWGFIIGGGGTTRAAVYALSRMGIERIWLINRDLEETAEIVKQFPQYDLQPLTSVSQWTPECAAKVICGVGAIPSFEPVTEGERNVYALAREVFGSWPEQAQGGGKEKRLFMEMCYKPRKTLLYNIALENGWTPIGGVEAMLEQGFAQSRAWLLNSAASPWGKGQKGELGESVEEGARSVVRS